ncbi:gag pol polyprotein [Lasius niger]|uniref:Gag pol polyprotein n=1 Tax=Lasius niger TaxID=67767 RepID=A0A0J7N226_LASNI|nr:gag pol polyprotein [Lasius niger]
MPRMVRDVRNLEKTKKLDQPFRLETVGKGQQISNRLHVRDRISGQMFLVDTGADISLVPADSRIKGKPSELKLFAANNMRIDTFGESFRELDLGVRRQIRWNFCIAAVPYAIIGADLLACYGLLVDLKQQRLVDNNTKLYSRAIRKPAPIHSINAVDPCSKFFKILAEFPQITGALHLTPPADRDVFHHIITTGPPVAERARRLAPDKLKAAKAEFRALVETGICHPSRSPWASPIHLVLKKDSTWRVCGDYRRLNAITIPDKYPTPHLHDCSVNLYGKTVFSSLDLHKAYNQILMAPEDIEKTAVITPFGLFEYLFMTFGLRNASQSFQRYINRALGDLEFVFIYIDDILVASSSLDEHIEHLRVVFQRLKEFHLRLNVAKCVLGAPELEFLGYIVNGKGIRPTGESSRFPIFPDPKPFLIYVDSSV